MSRTPLWNMRLDPARKAAWTAVAAGEGVSLSEWLTRLGDGASGYEDDSEPVSVLAAVRARRRDAAKKAAPVAVAAPSAPARPDSAPARARRARQGPCAHRVPTDQFCKRCD